MSTSHSNLSAILDNHAASLMREGKYDDALRVAKTALVTARQAALQDAGNTPTLVRALDSLASVQRETGDVEGAEAAYREAIDLAEASQVEHRLQARLQAHLATLLDFSQREADSVPIYEKAIIAYEELQPPDEDTAAQLRNNLAMIYKGLGKFALAEQHYLRALEILENKYTEGSDFVATVYNNLGTLYYSAGFASQAQEFHADALSIRERLLGPDHPDVAQSYCNLATVYYELGDDPSAVQCYERGLRILEHHVGEDPSSYEAVGNDYIALLGAMHEDRKAAAFQKRMQNVLGTS